MMTIYGRFVRGYAQQADPRFCRAKFLKRLRRFRAASNSVIFAKVLQQLQAMSATLLHFGQSPHHRIPF
jgi:hypothetical protein